MLPIYCERLHEGPQLWPLKTLCIVRLLGHGHPDVQWSLGRFPRAAAPRLCACASSKAQALSYPPPRLTISKGSFQPRRMNGKVFLRQAGRPAGRLLLLPPSPACLAHISPTRLGSALPRLSLDQVIPKCTLPPAGVLLPPPPPLLSRECPPCWQLAYASLLLLLPPPAPAPVPAPPLGNTPTTHGSRFLPPSCIWSPPRLPRSSARPPPLRPTWSDWAAPSSPPRTPPLRRRTPESSSTPTSAAAAAAAT